MTNRNCLKISRFIFVLIACMCTGNTSIGASIDGDAELSSRLKTQFESQIKTGGFKKSEIGIWIADSDGNGVVPVFAEQADKLFIPASISKIPTAAAILSLLPQNHKFKTIFAVDANNTSLRSNLKVIDGTLKGPLYLIGGGDPAFVSETMWNLVNALVRTGVTEIDGDIVVDDSRFDKIRFGEDRQRERVDRAYDAPLGAMSLNWNAITAWVRPGAKPGDRADVSLDVMNSFLKLENKTKTSNAGKPASIVVERLPTRDPKNGESFQATGTIGVSQPETAIYKSIREPDMWAGNTARLFIESRGVKVKGIVKNGTAPASLKILASENSKPLSLILADMMKWSNNFVADMLVKNVSAEAGDKPATIAKGMELVRGYLENKAGLTAGEYEFINGAGFTRENRFTPRQLGSVLTAVRRDFRIFPEFLSSLPIAGVDGTLRERFKGTDAVGWVRAKTGLLNGAIGLAGFAGTEKGKIFTFVFMFNGSAGREDAARRLFDQMAGSIVKIK